MAKVIKRSGGLLIKDKKILVARAKGHGAIFLPPGGGVENGETMEQALIRELLEELRIEVQLADLEKFNSHFKPADKNEGFDLQLDAFIVRKWSGEIVPDNEIEEVRWIDSDTAKGFKLGSIFESEILPKLIEKGLIS